jgi:hypothetical protein
VVAVVVVVVVVQRSSTSHPLGRAAGSPPVATTLATGTNPAPPAGAFDVVRFGADPTGKQDSTLAIRSAFAAAAGAGGTQTVYFPAGTYILDRNDGAREDFLIQGGSGSVINILGAGSAVTRIVEEVGTKRYPGIARPKAVFVIEKMDHFSFSGLTVDAQTYNAGDTLDDYGSYTTIEHSAFLGAANGNGQPQSRDNVYDLRVLALCSANPSNPTYGNVRIGNVVNDVQLNGIGVGGNDDLDFSCQDDGTISNITDTGLGMVLYHDHDVTVTDYHFTPKALGGGQVCGVQCFGWNVQAASSDITINDFVTAGYGGIITNPKYVTSNVTINGERMTRPGFALNIGDAQNTVIENSQIDQIDVVPAKQAKGITVEHSAVRAVRCAPNVTISNLQGIAC